MAESATKTGHVLIVTNTNFDSVPYRQGENLTRKGATQDKNNLCLVFQDKLRFQLLGGKVFEDLDKYEYSESPFWIHEDGQVISSECKCLTCLIQGTDFTGSQCFVVAISTHGARSGVSRQQEIYLSDYPDAHPLTLAELIDALSDEKCRSLSGIPRVIILTVCRADTSIAIDLQWDHGVEVNVDPSLGHIRQHVVPMPARTDSGPTFVEDSSSQAGVESEMSTIALDDKSTNSPGLDISQNDQIAGDSPPKRKRETSESEAPNLNQTDESTEVTPHGHARNYRTAEESNQEIEATDDTGEPVNIPTGPIQVGGTENVSDEEIQRQQMYIPDRNLQNLPENFLVVFGTYLGKRSVHNLKTGSWIIEEMANVVKENDFSKEPEINFLSLLTKLSGKVAARESAKGYKTAVTVYHRLTKPLIFRPHP